MDDRQQNQFQQPQPTPTPTPSAGPATPGYNGNINTAPGYKGPTPEMMSQPAIPMYQTPNYQMDPEMEDFASTLPPAMRDVLSRDPTLQASMFDADNFTKANAGIFRQQENGLQPLSVDKYGRQLYQAPEYKDFNNPRAGEHQLTTFGGVLDKAGAFENKQDADNFAKYTKLAGDPKFMGIISQQIMSGDKKGAVNTLLNQFGAPALEQMLLNDPIGHDDKGNPIYSPEDQQNRAGIATAFSAYNLISNWDAMNTTQRSLAIGGMALHAYKFATGENLASKYLVKGSDGSGLTVGGAMNVLAAGFDTYSLIRNWEQLDTVQKVLYGSGSAMNIAQTARQMGFLNGVEAVSANGAAVPNVSAISLMRSGYTSTPSAGVGAISGPASGVPQGYVVTQSLPNGQVIAVPEATYGSTATANGASQTTTLNSGGANGSGGTASGGADYFTRGAYAASGAIQLYQGVQAYRNGEYVGGSINLAAGTMNLAAAAGSTLAQQYVPYVNVAMGAYGLYKTGEYAADAPSGGRRNTNSAASGAMAGAQIGSYFGGVGAVVGAVVGGLYGLGASYFGSSKGERQMIRDKGRGWLQEKGFLDDKYQATLADGSKVDMGTDKYEDKDFEGELNGKTIGLTNVLAAATGLNGKALESMSIMYAKGAVSNAGDDYEKAKKNVQSFAAQMGMTPDNVQGQLDIMLIDGKIDEQQHAAYSAGAQELFKGMEQAVDPNQNGPDKTRHQYLSPGTFRDTQTGNLVHMNKDPDPGPRRASNGAVGGTQLAAGLYKLQKENPQAYSAMIGATVARNSWKGSEADEGKDSSIRNWATLVGLTGQGQTVTLADGTIVDMSFKNGAAKRPVRNPGALVGDDRDRTHFNAWEADYTNELDYSSNMMANALVRLMTGGEKNKGVNRLGAQLGNAALANVGYGAPMSPETFAKTQANLRAMYSRVGITRREDAYALANQYFAEGNINELDLHAMHQAFNMVFDDRGMNYAQMLSDGRFKGIEAAQKMNLAGMNFGMYGNGMGRGQQAQDMQTSGNITGRALATMNGRPSYYAYQAPGGQGNYQSALTNYVDPWINRQQQQRY